MDRPLVDGSGSDWMNSKFCGTQGISNIWSSKCMQPWDAMLNGSPGSESSSQLAQDCREVFDSPLGRAA
jgi:hypothetical protein